MVEKLLLTIIIGWSGHFVKISGDLSGTFVTLRSTDDTTFVFRGLEYVLDQHGDTVSIYLTVPQEEMITRIGIIKRAAKICLPKNFKYEISLSLHNSRGVFVFDEIDAERVRIHVETGSAEIIFGKNCSSGRVYRFTSVLSTLRIRDPGLAKAKEFRIDCGGSKISIDVVSPLLTPIKISSTLGLIEIRIPPSGYLMVSKNGLLNVGPGRISGTVPLGTVEIMGTLNRITEEVTK